MEFLFQISHTSDAALARTLHAHGDEEEVEISSDEEEEEPAIDDVCAICLEVRRETYVLLPCGHSSLCERCATELRNRNHHCHMCRSQV